MPWRAKSSARRRNRSSVEWSGIIREAETPDRSLPRAQPLLPRHCGPWDHVVRAPSGPRMGLPAIEAVYSRAAAVVRNPAELSTASVLFEHRAYTLLFE